MRALLSEPLAIDVGKDHLLCGREALRLGQPLTVLVDLQWSIPAVGFHRASSLLQFMPDTRDRKERAPHREVELGGAVSADEHSFRYSVPRTKRHGIISTERPCARSSPSLLRGPRGTPFR